MSTQGLQRLGGTRRIPKPFGVTGVLSLVFLTFLSTAVFAQATDPKDPRDPRDPREVESTDEKRQRLEIKQRQERDPRYDPRYQPNYRVDRDAYPYPKGTRENGDPRQPRDPRVDGYIPLDGEFYPNSSSPQGPYTDPYSTPNYPHDGRERDDRRERYPRYDTNPTYQTDPRYDRDRRWERDPRRSKELPRFKEDPRVDGDPRYRKDPYYDRDIQYDRYPTHDRDLDNEILPNKPKPSVDYEDTKKDWHDVRHLEGLERAKEVRDTRRLDALPRFGASFFRDGKNQLVDAADATVPPDYLLSYGDQLNVVTYNVKGGEVSQILTLDEKGEIYLPGAGPVDLNATTMVGAQTRLNQAVMAKFPNMRVRINMSRVRKIRVFLVGESSKPGGYLINPGSSALDALLASGGPTKSGSYRNIQVQRNGQTVATVDLYELLVYGRSINTRLKNGDKIFIPASNPEVTIDGEVRRPAIYELQKETTLAQVLALAGGLKPEAYAGGIHIERVAGNTARKLQDVPMKEAAKTKIMGGDVILCFPVLEDLANGVYLDGAVKRPGWYALNPGMTITQLLRRAQGMAEGAFPGHAEVFRQDSPEQPLKMLGFELDQALQGDPQQNIVLKAKDRVILYSRKEATFYRERVRVEGEVTRPGEYPRFGEMKLRDLIYQAGGITPEASLKAEVARPNRKTGKVDLIPIDLENLLSSNSSPANIALQDLDLVVVRKELRGRMWPASVTLGGEVARPGVYAINPQTDTLRNLLERAGGLSDRAYPRGTIFVRRNEQLIHPDNQRLTEDVFETLQVIAKQIAQAEALRRGSQQQVAAAGVAGVDLTALTRNTATVLPRQITRILSSGRVPINLQGVLKSGTGDPGLKDGDVIYIPMEQNTVMVSGAVVMPTALLHTRDWRPRDYIERAGGFTKDAEQGEVLVMRVTGEIIRADKLDTLEPGDVVLVPPKAIVSRPDAFERLLNFLQVGIGSAAVYNLLTR